MHIHHIGYLVGNMDTAAAAFEKLGFVQNKGSVTDEARQIMVCFMHKDGYLIELVSPLGKESPFYGLLKKYKNAPYHICYVTDDFEADIEKLTEEGYMLFQPPFPASAIGSRKVCFLMNAAIGMIELLEEGGPYEPV